MKANNRNRPAPTLTALSLPLSYARRFPLAYLVLATYDREDGRHVDWGGLRAVEQELRGATLEQICETLEVL